MIADRFHDHYINNSGQHRKHRTPSRIRSFPFCECRYLEKYRAMPVSDISAVPHPSNISPPISARRDEMIPSLNKCAILSQSGFIISLSPRQTSRFLNGPIYSSCKFFRVKRYQSSVSNSFDLSEFCVRKVFLYVSHITSAIFNFPLRNPVFNVLAACPDISRHRIIVAGLKCPPDGLRTDHL